MPCCDVIGLGFGLEVTRKEVGMLVTVRKEMVGTRRLELLTSTVSSTQQG